MYQELFSQLEKRYEHKKGGVQQGCDFDSFKVLYFEVKRDLDCELPRSYTNLLRITDGFYLNDVLIFASQPNKIADGVEIPSFVETNLKYRIEDKRFLDYLVFGISKKDQFLFVSKLATKENQIIDAKTLFVVERVSSFEGLISHALKRSLFAY